MSCSCVVCHFFLIHLILILAGSVCHQLHKMKRICPFFFFSYFLSVHVCAQDIWASLYSSDNCASSTLETEQTLTSSNSCVQYGSLSLRFQCTGSSEDSGWSADVYMSGDCSGFAVTSISGTDACDCEGRSFLGTEIGLTVSCTGAAPVTCPTVTLAPTTTPQSEVPTLPSEMDTPVWGAAYTSTDCNPETYLSEGIVNLDDGGCLAMSMDGTTVSMSFSCDGLTAESSWSAGMYLTDDCTGFRMLSISAEDACTCGGVTFMDQPFGARVNCAGEEPTCDGGGEGGGEEGANSNGEGSGNGMETTGILLVVVVSMGFLVTMLVVKVFYDKKCQTYNHECLGEDVGINTIMEKDTSSL